MWIVTEHGFFSFVVDRKDPTQVHLRARIREDLERNFPDAEVYEKPGADYLFRAKVSKADVAERMAELILTADITGHFKDEVNRRAARPEHGSRSSAMYAFWNGMAACQPYAPYSKVPRPKPLPAKPKLSRPGDHGIPAKGSSAPQGLYGGPTAGYGRDFDWDASTTSSGTNVSSVWDDDLTDDFLTSQDYTEAEWAAMSPEARDAILDEEELRTEQAEARLAALRQLDQGVPALDEPLFVQPADSYPAPRSTRRQRRAARKNKGRRDHNQRG